LAAERLTNLHDLYTKSFLIVEEVGAYYGISELEPLSISIDRSEEDSVIALLVPIDDSIVTPHSDLVPVTKNNYAFLCSNEVIYTAAVNVRVPFF
jgi:hypothetical protein